MYIPTALKLPIIFFIYMSNVLNQLKVIDSIEPARAIKCSCAELSSQLTIDKNDLMIISQNIRSIYCNFDDFLLMLTCLPFQPDIIVMTECRLSAIKCTPKLDNYNSFHTQIQMNQNDGVVVYIRESLQYNVKEIQLQHASCLQLQISNTLILCIYRSPSNTSADGFVDSLGAHLETFTMQSSIVITGDININIAPKPVEPNHEYRNRIKYLNTLSEYGILAGHTIPTRGINCLDHFMLKINRNKLAATIAVIPTSITDHSTILLSLSNTKLNYSENKIKTTVDYISALKHLQQKISVSY